MKFTKIIICHWLLSCCPPFHFLFGIRAFLELYVICCAFFYLFMWCYGISFIIHRSWSGIDAWPNAEPEKQKTISMQHNSTQWLKSIPHSTNLKQWLWCVNKTGVIMEGKNVCVDSNATSCFIQSDIGAFSPPPHPTPSFPLLWSLRMHTRSKM